jgi:hypothetical protein
MSIPANPVLHYIYWLINTPGFGGLAVAAIILSCLGTFAVVLRWILAGAQADEPSTYTYPTSALHHSD